jgi:hypothetical protein
MKWAGHVECVGNERYYKVFVVKAECNRQLSRSTHRGEDIIKMDLRKIIIWVMDWIYLIQFKDICDVAVHAIMKPWVP